MKGSYFVLQVVSYMYEFSSCYQLVQISFYNYVQ